jgi:hypothetical protein
MRNFARSEYYGRRVCGPTGKQSDTEENSTWIRLRYVGEKLSLDSDGWQRCTRYGIDIAYLVTKTNGHEHQTLTSK